MDKPLTILYFAWLRERVGAASEEVVLPEGVRTVSALVDFLDAQRDYRAVQQGYLVLVGSYLTAAGQLKMAVGREEIR